MLLTRFYPLSLLKQLPVTNILQSNALLILYYVFTLQSCDRAVGGELFDQRAGTTPHYCTDGLHLLLIDVDIRLCLAQQKNYKTIIVRVTLHVTTNALALGGTCTEFQLLMVQRACWSDLKLDLGQISIHPPVLVSILGHDSHPQAADSCLQG